MLLLGCTSIIFWATVINMVILALNVSGCSPENFPAFGFILEDYITWTEGLNLAGMIPCIPLYPLVTTCVMADRETLNNWPGHSWLQNGKLLAAVLISATFLIVVVSIYYINTVSTALWRGQMTLPEPQVPEDVIAKGKGAIIDYVVTQIICPRGESGGNRD